MVVVAIVVVDCRCCLPSCVVRRFLEDDVLNSAGGALFVAAAVSNRRLPVARRRLRRAAKKSSQPANDHSGHHSNSVVIAQQHRQGPYYLLYPGIRLNPCCRSGLVFLLVRASNILPRATSNQRGVRTVRSFLPFLKDDPRRRSSCLRLTNFSSFLPRCNTFLLRFAWLDRLAAVCGVRYACYGYYVRARVCLAATKATKLDEGRHV